MFDVHDDRNTVLLERVGKAEDVTPDLMASILGHSVRLVALNKAGRVVTQLNALVAAEAWTDAALALAAIEAPHWTLRRLARDGDVWQCSLSRQPILPIELDDAAEGAHPVLPLAIVIAMIEARSRHPQLETDALRQQPQPASVHVICCDNFA